MVRAGRESGQAAALLIAVGILTACSPATAPRAHPPAGAHAAAPAASASPAVGPSTPPAPAPPVWREDDFEAARADAARQGKLLLVDAWAPWCHTCLSMKHEVLESPALGAYGDRVVFAALDTDRPTSAAFLTRYAVEVWPTFFVLDPARDRVLAVHGGAASLVELREVLDGALTLRASGAPGAFESELASAAEAYAARRFPEAADLYERAAGRAHPRAAEALLGAIRARHEAGDIEACARVAEAGLEKVHGAARAADFTYHARKCAESLPAGPRRAAIEERGRTRLRQLAADPPAGATVDDRADALAMLADAERAGGDEAAARAAIETRVRILEQAAAAARSPAEAATFDYMRMRAYQDAGRPEDAVRMLEERTRQTPDSYEPFARLASVLARIDPARALAPLRRAIALSYGPRRLGYLELEATLHEQLGDRPAAIDALGRLVEAHRALGPGHADAARRAAAEARLEQARRATARP